MSNAKILIVDDDPDIIDFLRYNLEKEGYTVKTARNGKEAIYYNEHFCPDLILLDVMMPETDGIEACKEIRESGKNKDVIIAFLTARGEDFSQIKAYEAGGDDYIIKPVRIKVLLSKIKSLLKRKKSFVGEVLETGGFKIDKNSYTVIKDGEKYTLPRKEFELLFLLASNPGHVFRREEIYELVWGTEVFVGDRTIDVHIRKLRQRFGDDIIKTIKGVGYKFSS